MGDYTSIKASNHVALPPSLSWKPNLAISLPAGAVCAHHQRSWCREQRAPGKGEKGGSASWAHAVRHFLLPTASTLDVCSPHCSCSHHPPLSCASLWFVSPVQILALVMVSLLHLVYLRLCLPFRMRIELAAGGCRFLLEHVCHCCSSACTLCLSQASLFWSFQCKDEAHASSTPSRFQAPRTLLGRSPPPHHPLTPAPAPCPFPCPEMVASLCDLGVFICGIVLIARPTWTAGERRSMGMAMLALQAAGFLTFMVTRILLAARTLVLTLRPLLAGVLRQRGRR